MAVLLNVLVIFFTLNVVLNPNGNFLVVPLLHSVSDTDTHVHTSYTSARKCAKSARPPVPSAYNDEIK